MTHQARALPTHHTALGRRVGIPGEKLDALTGDATSPLFSGVERLVIRYAEEMTWRVQVDPALAELRLTVASANFTNRFNDALRIEP